VRVRSQLIDWDSLTAVGGEKHLESLRMVQPAKSLPIDRLHKLAKTRALRAAAEMILEAASRNDQDQASNALETANALANAPAMERPKTAAQLAGEWYEALGRDPLEGTVSPGIAALKRAVGRLDEGSMTLIGADTSVGKSTLALEMCLSAILDDEPVGYLSVEDPQRIFTERVISVLSGGMSAKQVREFRLNTNPHHDAMIDRSMRTMHAIGSRLQLSGCQGRNDREILEQMTMMARAGARLIVLDYIGVVGCSVKQQDRRNEIRWIATRFKARAAFTKTALVVVSQFQRPKDGDSGRKPTKHSFRESGDLEAMAEYAIVMWRKVEDDFAPVYCELAKSKTGNVGFGWTMQRKKVGGRLLEVRHHDEPDPRDEKGYALPDVEPDAAERWSVSQTARGG
jgi:replicative DNA helicase